MFEAHFVTEICSSRHSWPLEDSTSAEGSQMRSVVVDAKRTRLGMKKRMLRWELRTPGCETRWHFDRLAQVVDILGDV